MNSRFNLIFLTATSVLLATNSVADQGSAPVRVFIFAGQSNMEGADSHVRDVQRFPPFQGLDQPQPDVRFSYCIGRENKERSAGWTELKPVRNTVGPELSFARELTRHTDAPLAIIKCAAGGTHLGGDWNPDQPSGFKMYPLALKLVRDSLRELEQTGIEYRIEGFFWHQGENDMFNEGYMANYGENLKNFLASWRRDLKTPDLRFYVGELCTKTIWGMDLRPRMYAISRGQRSVTDADPRAEYIPTAHIGVEIGQPVGLHYHYGTLGQLEHGVNYATAYLRTLGIAVDHSRRLDEWPYESGSRVRLFVLAGHRNMEGERAFVQDLTAIAPDLNREDRRVAYRYSIGGGYRVSDGWEPLRPAGFYDTFGPELSFARTLQNTLGANLAVAKFTHSGSQMNDWTPDGTDARSRHIYPQFLEFIKQATKDLVDRGHEVELAGVFYHVGENEMSMPPYRKNTVKWLKSTVEGSRRDLQMPALTWYISQQPPTDHERVNQLDVTSELASWASEDDHVIHIRAFQLPPQPKRLVLNTAGIVSLGELLGQRYLSRLNQDR